MTQDTHGAAPTAPEDSTGKGMTRTRAWVIVGLLAIFLLINYADKALMGLAGPAIVKDLGLSREQFGVIQSSFFWVFAVGAIVLGAVAGRVNLRWYLALLMLVWVATMLPMVGTVGFTTVLVCRLILGFAEGPAYALANHTSQTLFPPEQRALASGVVTAGSSLGPLIMAPILTWIIVEWSWHAAFLVLAVVGIIWALVWLAFGESTTPKARKPKAPKGAPAQPAPGDTSLWAILITPTVIGVALLNFFSYWSTSLKVAWLPTYLADGLGYNLIDTGRLVAIPYATAAIFSITAGFVSNMLYKRGFSARISRGYLAGGLVVGSGLCMWGFTVLNEGILQMALVVLAFSLNTASIGVGFTALGDLIPVTKRATVMGLIVATSSMAGILSPLLIGFTAGGAARPVDGFEKGFAFVGIMMVVGALVATYFIRPDQDVKNLREREELKAA